MQKVECAVRQKNLVLKVLEDGADEVEVKLFDFSMWNSMGVMFYWPEILCAYISRSQRPRPSISSKW